MNLGELHNKNIKEYETLLKKQLDEREQVQNQQDLARKKWGNTDELALKFEAELKSLDNRHKSERQKLYDGHVRKYDAQQRINKAVGKSEEMKQYEVYAEMNALRREEREAMSNRAEEERKNNQSLIDKIKEKWRNGRDREK